MKEIYNSYYNYYTGVKTWNLELGNFILAAQSTTDGYSVQEKAKFDGFSNEIIISSTSSHQRGSTNIVAWAYFRWDQAASGVSSFLHTTPRFIIATHFKYFYSTDYFV
jgi:hypothetical protein